MLHINRPDSAHTRPDLLDKGLYAIQGKVSNESGQPNGDKSLASDNIAEQQAASLKDLPAYMLENIVARLYEDSPKSVFSLAATAKPFRNNSSIRAALLALQSRHIGTQIEAGIPISAEAIAFKILECNLIDPAARGLTIIELERAIPEIKDDEQFLKFHCSLWDLANSHQATLKSQVLRPFIESLAYFIPRLKSVWFENYRKILKDNAIPGRAHLYESLAESLRYFDTNDTKFLFPTILNDIIGLPIDERVLPLTRLSRCVPLLQDRTRDETFAVLLQHIRPTENEQSIRILCELLGMSRHFSIEQHNELDALAIKAMPHIQDYKVLREFVRTRAIFIASINEDRRFSTFNQTIEFLENNSALAGIAGHPNRNEWKFVIIAPLMLSHQFIEKSLDVYNAMARLSKHLPLNPSDPESHETYADLFQDQTRKPSSIVIQLIEACRTFKSFEFSQSQF